MKIRVNTTFELWEQRYFKLYKPEYIWWNFYYRVDLEVMCYQKDMSPEQAIQFWTEYLNI